MDTKRETDPSNAKSEKVYCLRVTRGNGQMDEQLATVMEEIYEASLRDPNSWDINPDKYREALEVLGSS